MFEGEYQHTLDDKARLILPVAFRGELEDGVYLVESQDRCLAGFPLAVYDEWRAAQRARLDPDDPRDRARLRRINTKVAKQLPDSQGRIVVPAFLRNWANLERDVVVNGFDDRIEIWDRGAWDAYMDEYEEDFVTLGSPAT